MPDLTHTIHGATGIPEPPEWAGYWTFVTATIIISFVLFLAEKNRLSLWMSFFTWTTQAAPSATGNQSQTTAPASGGSGGVPGLATNPAAGLPSSLGQFFNLPGIAPWLKNYLGTPGVTSPGGGLSSGS
jgi:hypothetical protein